MLEEEEEAEAEEVEEVEEEVQIAPCPPYPPPPPSHPPTHLLLATSAAMPRKCRAGTMFSVLHTNSGMRIFVNSLRNFLTQSDL